MGFLSDLFGGKTETNTKNYGESTSGTQANKWGLTQTAEDLLEQILGNKSGTTIKGSLEDTQFNTSVLRRLATEASGFTKENAIKDSQAASTAALKEVLNMALPDIRNAQTISGGYDDTTTKILKDNVFAQAANAGAKVTQDTIGQYGQILDALVGKLQQGLSLNLDATTKTSEDTSASTTSAANTRNIVEELINSASQGTEYGVGRNQGEDPLKAVTSVLSLFPGVGD
jgi:hypothetical protein